MMEQGGDVALLAVGSMVAEAIEVRDLLEKRGIHASLVNCRSVKPMDEKMLRQLANRPIVTMEEHVLTGGFGSVVCAFLSGEGLPAPILSFGIPDTFVQHGRRDQLLKYLGLTPELMTQRIVIALKNGEKASMSEKQRADVALVERGLCESRTKAQVSIMAGEVYVGTRRIDKASELIKPEDELEIRGKSNPYASRGGLKLEKAITSFQADLRGKVCMDIGAATGGFTDVCLQNGAAHVYAIDVGYGQFSWKLRNDPRVTLYERTNARLLTPDMLPLHPTVTVMDVSFISIRLILPVAAQLMGEEGVFYTLIKPQFEAGRDRIGKKGVIHDPKVHEDVLREIVEFAPSIGWQVQQLIIRRLRGRRATLSSWAKSPSGRRKLSR